MKGTCVHGKQITEAFINKISKSVAVSGTFVSTPLTIIKPKLKRTHSTSTYIVDDEECIERVESIALESPSITDPRIDTNRLVKRIDKTTSNTTFCGVRKSWNQCNGKPSNTFVPDNSIIEEESELIGALTKQLYLVEAQMQKVQSDMKRSEEQLRSKDQEIIRLKRKIKDCEANSKNQEAQRKMEQQQRRIQKDHSEYLYQRCMTLEHRIYDMEKFLADYGLIWVGDTNSPNNNPETVPNNFIETCYEQIIASIDQLNLAAGKGEVHVLHNEKGNGASFKTPTCMSLKFYKNGMTVQGGLLRPYDDPTAVAFLRDILEGYFPSELQQAYPHGVPFKVEDRRTQMYFSDTIDFPGHGYRLGKQSQADNTPMISNKTRRPSTASVKSGRRASVSKDNLPGSDFPVTPLTARSGKLKNPPVETPLEMYVLRSQILASHNNICSNSHLQSHINAALGLSSRKEKQRDIATRSVEYDGNAREGSQKSKGLLRFPSSGRCYHASSDRLSSKPSPSRLENTEDRPRQRTRSSSLPNSRISINSKSMTRTRPLAGFGNTENPQFSNCQRQQSSVKRSPRATRSTEPIRKNAPPILHQVNEPIGMEGELRLKVRSLNGGTVYLVHVSADESIARLYQLLDRAMARTIPRGYKIVLSGYSPRRLDQLGVTLRDIGITRDSVLHLVND
ncbi:UBX domain-containing protein 11 [Dufourea novaeangliae]|uniref:UBX domain-containing protein 11 n=1 Tax=Dufourea novaeangliae TaxID=178035 RepID=A0A154PQG8_DUFNO|nr:UBX domain-containing protein 11 [Dufourea novaeangliae]